MQNPLKKYGQHMGDILQRLRVKYRFIRELDWARYCMFKMFFPHREYVAGQ